MPNLKKDPSPPRPAEVAPEPNLYLSPTTGKYFVKRYVPALGKEKVLCLNETNRYKAILKKNQAIAQWLGSRAIRGDVYIDGLAFEILKALEADVKAGIKSEKTFLDFEGHVRLHILQPIAGSYAGLKLSEAATHWPAYRVLQRKLNPQRKLKHDRAHLRTIFKHAYDKELIHRMPEFRLDAFDTRVAKAEEYSNEEFATLLKEANPKLALKIETLMMTSLRANAVRLMRYEWINWETGEVRVPGWAMKMKEDHVVVFDKELLAKYRERYEKAFPVHCFPHRDDPSMPESRTDKGWQRLKKKFNIKKKRHWLRGSGMRRAVRAGVPGEIAQSAARVSSKVMRDHYFESDVNDRRQYSEAVRRSTKVVVSTPEASTHIDPEAQPHG